MEAKAARHRFVDVMVRHEGERAQGNDRLWPEWQATGAEYWVQKHPELAPYRGMDPRRVLTHGEIGELAELLRQAMDGVPQTWRLEARDDLLIERSAQVAWFHELLTSLYAPVDFAWRRVRGGDPAGRETLLRFLEADPDCHRSGYWKADIIDALTRLDLSDDDQRRLSQVLLAVVRKPPRREFRRYIRLARYLDNSEIRDALAGLAATGQEPAARNATWVLQGLRAHGPLRPNRSGGDSLESRG